MSYDIADFRAFLERKISIIKKYCEKLSFGAELYGVVSRNFHLSQGQLQTTLGGNYSLNKHFTLDFGVIVGRYPASPRLGGLAGLTIEYQERFGPQSGR